MDPFVLALTADLCCKLCRSVSGDCLFDARFARRLARVVNYVEMYLVIIYLTLDLLDWQKELLAKIIVAITTSILLCVYRDYEGHLSLWNRSSCVFWV